MIIGRSPELGAIGAAVERARQGAGTAMFLQGEAGMGKTTMIGSAAEAADGFQQLRMSAVEAEKDFAFAGLHELLLPLMGRLDQVPVPQANALRGAFALAESKGSGPLAIGAGGLSLLSTAGSERPVICLIDNAQWLDQATADALMFAARRIADESVFMLFASDDDGKSVLRFSDDDALMLNPLSRADSLALLQQVHSDLIAPSVAQVLVQECAGNPRALLDTPQLLTPEQRSGAHPLPTPLPSTVLAPRSVSRSIEGLSDPARDLLLGMAVAGTQTLRVIIRDDSESTEHLTEVEQAGLVELSGGTVNWLHPLTRNAAYQAASPEERRLAHRRIAESFGSDDRYRDRRAWHLAAAAVEPDEDLASDLAELAGLARDAMDHSRAAALFEASTRITLSSAQQSEWTLEAARCAWLAGQTERALTVLGRMSPSLGDSDMRVRIAILSAELAACQGRLHEHLAELLAISEDSPKIRSQDAVQLLMLASRAASGAQALDLAQAAIELTDLDPATGARFAATLTLARAHHRVGDEETASDLLATAANCETTPMSWSPECLVNSLAALVDWLIPNTHPVAKLIDDLADAAERQVTCALSNAYLAVGNRALWRGRWQEAESAYNSAYNVGLETGQRDSASRSALGQVVLDALIGREENLSTSLAADADFIAANEVVSALGFLSSGRPDRAAEAFAAVDMTRARQLLPPESVTEVDFLEAVTRTGGAAAARAQLDSMGEALSRDQQLWAKALVADDYEPAFEQALATWCAGDRQNPYVVSRLHLSFGERLRRDKRRGDARDHLRKAHEGFERLGATGWEEHARRELKATGEVARRRDPGAAGDLSPQQLQVALAIAGGATYREAAAQLYLSPKTIEFHVANIYRILGIGSRRELENLFKAQGMLS